MDRRAERDIFYIDAQGRKRLLARAGSPLPQGYDPDAAPAPVSKAVKARRKPEDKSVPAPAPVEPAPVVEEEQSPEESE